MKRKQELEDRLRRAQSWIDAARLLPDGQKHAEFVFLFVALNALNGQRRDEGDRDKGRKDREQFLRRIRVLHGHDQRQAQGTLVKALHSCVDAAGNLIINYFLRDTYWDRQAPSKEIIQQFARARSQAEFRLKQGKYEEVLDLVLKRLRVLRNQVFHGCVTYGRASKGYPSLVDGLAVLRELVPALYQLMDRHGHHVEWPPIPYPRVGSDAHPVVDQVL